MGRGYSKEILEYMRLRFETIGSDIVIAREVARKFEIIDRDTETIRKYINKYRKKVGVAKEKKVLKRLFFDIETSYVKALVWRPGEQRVPITNIRGYTKIICISYKWQHEDKVHTLVWDKNQCDKKVVKEFIKILAEANEVVAHNGDRFDVKHVRTRAVDHNLLMYTKYRTNDTLKKARRFFNFLSNKLDYIGQFLEVGGKTPHEGMIMWEMIQEGTPAQQKEYLKKMVEYCERDVILLQDAFTVMSPYIDHNTNYAVLSGGYKWQCPECASKDVKMHHTDTTAMGWVKRHMCCNSCKKSYHISGKSYENYLIYQYQNKP
jgi:predicted PolB exonuclease-like 3'-5' exonuclease